MEPLASLRKNAQEEIEANKSVPNDKLDFHYLSALVRIGLISSVIFKKNKKIRIVNRHIVTYRFCNDYVQYLVYRVSYVVHYFSTNGLWARDSRLITRDSGPMTHD